MSILSNLFGSSDNDSESQSADQNSTDIVSDVSAVLGIEASNHNESYSEDEDGNVDYSSSQQDFGLDLDTDSLLDVMRDTASFDSFSNDG